MYCMTEINNIIWSGRKWFALVVERDSTLTVRAPRNASLEAVKNVVHRKREWIRKKREHARQTFEPRKPKEYVSGEWFYYLGEKYELLIVENPGAPLALRDKFLLDREHGGAAGAVFVDWYTSRATLKITERVEHWAGLAGLRHGGIRINSASKRWGSCGRNGRLNFSWRLVMAPHAALDYVVVHELSHLVHMNHSRDFWNTVRVFMPDYKIGRQWLKNHGHLLMV